MRELSLKYLKKGGTEKNGRESKILKREGGKLSQGMGVIKSEEEGRNPLGTISILIAFHIHLSLS